MIKQKYFLIAVTLILSFQAFQVNGIQLMSEQARYQNAIETEQQALKQIESKRVGLEIVTDDNTLSNYKEVHLQNMDFEITLDFDKKILSGTVVLSLMGYQELKQITLDQWDMTVSKVEFDSSAHHIAKKELKDWKNDFSQVDISGGSLVIQVDKAWETTKDSQVTYGPIPMAQLFNIYITYQVNEKKLGKRSGFTFVDAEQTFGKQKPIFYTQNEPIYLRTWIPTQDTPVAKFLFTGVVKVKKSLGLKVYMSADKDSITQEGEYECHNFVSKHHLLPGYYIGIVVGDFKFQTLANGKDGEINLIAEESVFEEAKAQLSDAQSYLTWSVEFMNFKYEWKKFQVVMMPPNYPYEGASHPQLTYVSSSILKSGKTGKTVLLHELARGYFGNMLTCANWRNLWLNEGFATYMERNGQKVFFGENYMQIDRIDANFEMEDVMTDFEKGMIDNFTKLYPEVKGLNPDEVMTIVPYEKGYQFLVYLEQIITPLQVQLLIQSWLDNDEFRTVTWLDFREFFNLYLSKNLPQYVKDGENIDWDTWMNGTGMAPATLNKFESSDYDEVIGLADKFLQFAGSSLPKSYKDVSGWSPIKQYVFIDFFRKNHWTVNRRIIKQLDSIYKFSASEDPYLKAKWFALTSLTKYNIQENDNIMIQFMGETGREKFLIPIYEGLVKSGQELKATQIFNTYKQWYHPVVVDMIDLIINGN